MTKKPPLPHEAQTTYVDETFEALMHACRPEALSPELNESLIAQALGIEWEAPKPAYPQLSDEQQESDEPTELELEAAARLAEAMEGLGSHPLAELATALKNAVLPESLSQIQLERLVRIAGARSPQSPQDVARHGHWLRRASPWALSIGVAAAVALMFLPKTEKSRQDRVAEETLALSRSLSPLFATESPSASPSERMDRIVMARTRDLRHNRYLSWRVR